MTTIAPASAPLARLAPLLARWIGLDTATVGASAIERACRERMEAIGIESLAAYVDRVTADAEERGELIERVVVAESWFFRDTQVFEFLARFVRQLVRQADRGPARILSAPCAGGEEPYSVAMAMFDAGIASHQFTIDAVDVSQRALERAAAGRYSANAFRNADLSFRERWFQTVPGASQIDPRIRQQVRFIHGNLLDETCLTQLERGGPYDVVFCRNLLIYLDEAARTSMERTFERLLGPDGVLLLGAAEPPIIRGGWTAAGETSVFALRRSEKPVEMPTARPLPRRPRGPLQPSRVAAASVTAAAPTVPPPATPPRNESPPVSLDAVLRQAGELANTGRLADAITFCDEHQKHVGPSADLFFLTGMLHQSAGDLDRAETCFHKTLYLDGTHADALLALALIASQRGDGVMAEKYRQSAVRVAARGGGS